MVPFRDLTPDWASLGQHIQEYVLVGDVAYPIESGSYISTNTPSCKICCPRVLFADLQGQMQHCEEVINRENVNVRL